MKLPNKVKIFHKVYKIQESGSAICAAEYAAGKLLDGHCDYEKCVLTLRPGHVLSSRQAALAHECIHAMLEGLDQTPEEDERLVQYLEFPLVQFIQDNEKVVKYLGQHS